MLFHERGLQVEAAPHGQEPTGRARHPAPQGPRQVRCGAPGEGPEVTRVVCGWLQWMVMGPKVTAVVWLQ